MSALAYGHRPIPDPETMRCRICGCGCEVHAPDGIQHVRRRVLCGAPMTHGETCARGVGHRLDSRGQGHRTRWAMDNDTRSSTARYHARRQAAA